MLSFWIPIVWPFIIMDGPTLESHTDGHRLKPRLKVPALRVGQHRIDTKRWHFLPCLDPKEGRVQRQVLCISFHHFHLLQHLHIPMLLLWFFANNTIQYLQTHHPTKHRQRLKSGLFMHTTSLNVYDLNWTVLLSGCSQDLSCEHPESRTEPTRFKALLHVRIQWNKL